MQVIMVVNISTLQCSDVFAISVAAVTCPLVAVAILPAPLLHLCLANCSQEMV